MTTFYTVVNWLVILGYWLLIAGVTLRILMKRRAVPSAMAWLLIIYILPLVGIIAYLSFGELHLGKRRAERARAMWPSTAKWLNDLKACKHIFAEDNSPVAESLFKLCERRQGIGGVKGNQLQLLTESDDVMQALIRDIQLARHNIEMVFYIWQPGGMADSVAESLMAAARRALPTLDRDIAEGDFSALFDWLRQNIWQHGSRFTTSQLIQQATGEDLNSRYFREHLTTRYL